MSESPLSPSPSPPPQEPGAAGGSETVLCVDDEPNILSSLRRSLRSLRCRVITADSGAQALELLSRERIDVVISDMRMPGMNGAELLERVHQGWPGAVRILLTGHADMASTVAAINRGRIDRYLNKPWDEQELQATVRQGFEHIALRREKERLEALTRVQNDELRDLNASLEQRVEQRTAELSQANEKVNKNFLTSIKVFSNLIDSRGGQMAGHGRRVADLARKLAREINLDASQTRDVFVAGLLHDIGLIGVPDAVLAMPVARLRPEDLTAYCEHPVLGEQALMPLDDLQPVAAIIRSHHERYDGRGYPDRLCGTEIPIGARILAVVDAYDDLQSGHVTAAMATIEEARTLLRKGRSSQFDPEVLDVFLQMTEPERRQQLPELRIGSDALEPDMILARDLVSREGVMLLAAGQGMTPAVIQRIRAFERRREETFVLSIRPHRAVARPGAASAAAQVPA